MIGLKRSSLGVLLSVASSLCVGSFAPQSWAQGESGVQACAHAYEDAQVQRNGGHLKAAQEQLKICVQDQCPDFVRSDCGQWLSEVNSALPTVTFAAVDSAGADLIDVKVSIDGTVVTEQLDGRAVELDPGQHALVFEYQGHQIEQKLLVRQGEKNRVVRAQLPTDKDSDGDGIMDVDDKCANEAGDKEHQGCPPPVVQPPPTPRGGIHPYLLGTFIAGGVGAAGFITSAVFLQLENSEAEDAKKECPNDTSCTDDRRKELVDSNVFKANVQTAGLIVGGVGVVTGGVLFYLWLKDQQHPPPEAAEAASTLHLDVTGTSQGGFVQLQGAF